MNKDPHDFRDHKAHMQWKQERDVYRTNVPLIPQDMSGGSAMASTSSGMLQKALNNPLVPLGMLTTVGCLIGMMVATLRRSSKDAQLFMRGRCLAQGLTVASLVGGAVMFGIGAPSQSALHGPPLNAITIGPPKAEINKSSS